MSKWICTSDKIATGEDARAESATCLELMRNANRELMTGGENDGNCSSDDVNAHCDVVLVDDGCVHAWHELYVPNY